MDAHADNLTARMAGLLVRNGNHSRLLMVGRWQHIQDWPSQQEDSEAWHHCYENLDSTPVHAGSARAIANASWHLDFKQETADPAATSTSRLVACLVDESDVAEATTGNPRIQLAVHCNSGSAEATLEFLEIWGGQPTWNLVGRAVAQLIEMIEADERRVWSNFDPSCRLTYKVAKAPPMIGQVVLGEHAKIALQGGEVIAASNADRPQALLPGSFNPLHAGHQVMAEVAEQRLGLPVDFELSVENADKPPLDYLEIERRTQQDFGNVGSVPDHPVEVSVGEDATGSASPLPRKQRRLWLTRAATFDRKSKLFPGTVFLVGADTIVRIANPRFYGNDSNLMERMLQYIADQGCRFLIFGRVDETAQFLNLGNFRLPSTLLTICDEVPESEFRMDISSTQLRG